MVVVALVVEEQEDEDEDEEKGVEAEDYDVVQPGLLEGSKGGLVVISDTL